MKTDQKTLFLLPYWKKAVVPTLFLLISTLVSFAYPLFPKWAIDDVVTHKNYAKLFYLACTFLVLVVFQRLFSYLNEITFFRFQKESILDIQKRLLNRVFYYPLEFFDKNHSGYLIGRIRGDVTGLSYIFSSGLVMGFMDLVKFIGGFVILLSMNIKLTLISVCIMPFLILKIAASRSEIMRINQRILEENAKLEKELSDAFQGVEVLRSFSKEEEGISRTGNALSDYQQVEIKRNVTLSRYNNVVASIVHLGEILLLYFGIREVIIGNLTIGGYVAISGYLIYLYSPVQNLSTVAVLIDYAKRSYTRIKELLDILPEVNGKLEINKIDYIEIKDLSFSYSGLEGIIKDLNFKINKGDRVLVTGRSGSGKSTLVKLLLGLYRQQQGSICFNGIDSKLINIKKLRERIGYISQNVFLFNKTMRENIVFENTSIPNEDLIKILEECSLDKKVKSLKKGLDEEISEKGANLSGGERERIALARALIKDPELIIIDEGTSDLDMQTETKIMRILEERFKDRMIIRITHRIVEEDGWKTLMVDEHP